MTTSSKLIIAALVVAVVIIGIGYANVTDQILKISGDLGAVATQSNFKIAFEEAIDVVQPAASTVAPDTVATASAEKLTEITASFDVEGLTEVGQTASATFTIANNSTDLIADNLTATITKGNESGYFQVTKTELSKTTLNPTEKATITVTVKLIKTPLQDQSESLEVQISATPKEPTA